VTFFICVFLAILFGGSGFSTNVLSQFLKGILEKRITKTWQNLKNFGRIIFLQIRKNDFTHTYL
jgi:hypothetical protein